MLTEELKVNKRLTIKDIADLAGVSKAAVSAVLNNKQQVGKAKQKKILEIISKYNYSPRVSARALSTKRTYQIGYLVSSKVTLGLANSYYATIHAGICEACRKHGYYVLASTYDLSTIKDFVMPEKIRQATVDGLIIAGTVASEVIEQLKHIGIPYIIVGREESPSISNSLTMDFNFEANYVNIIDYHYKLGHRYLCLAYTHDIFLKRFMSAVETSNQKCKGDPVKFTYELLREMDDNMFVAGEKLAQKWLKESKKNRFTTLIANDQTCCGFISELAKSKIASCPDDISIFSPQNTPLSRWNSLPVSTLNIPIFDKSIIVAGLVIDLAEKKTTKQQVQNVLIAENQIYEFIIRKTTGTVPVVNN